jgi:RimJ/RimL family protein N-acetyltransferase
VSRAFGTSTLDGVVGTFYEGLCRSTGVAAEDLERPAVSVVGEAKRETTGFLSIWRARRHLIVRCAPADVPRLTGLASTTLDDLEAEVAASGFERAGAGLLHVLHPTGLRRPEAPAGITVRRLDPSDPDDARHLGTLVAAVPAADAAEAEFDPAHPDRCLFGAFDDQGRLVGEAGHHRWADDDRFADIGVLVHGDARRRGVGRTVVARLVERIFADGYLPLYACSRTNDGSRRVAGSLGFRLVAETVAFWR